jgi:uncharacterized protein
MQHSIVESIAGLVEEKFRSDGTGHDWHHISRVRRTAISIGKAEGADMLLVELGALLHDIADHKFHNHDLEEGPKQAMALITGHGGSAELAEKVAQIVAEVSFKGAGVQTPVSSIEAAVVQDADRLDAIGAIGIARAFAYGGSKHRPLYDPDRPPAAHYNFRDYATDQGHTINHFYEKLLLLKDRMQTETGKRMAAERHQFMEIYIRQFMAEWNGVK